PLDISRQNRVHEAGLAFKSIVHVDEAEANDVALVVTGCHAAEVNTPIAFEHFLDVVEINFAHVCYRINPDGVSSQRRQCDDGMGYTSPLLDQITVVRHDVVARHGSNDGYLFHDSSFSCMNKFTSLCRRGKPPQIRPRYRRARASRWVSRLCC